MNIRLKKYIFFVLILLSFNSVFSVGEKLTIYSPNYFNEQNNIYDYIHYVENEHLSFKFCTESDATDMTFNLVCSDQKQILEILKDNREPKSNCFFSNTNLDLVACDDFKLEITYNIDNKEKKVTREFKKQKQSKLINHILGKDTDELDPEELSYYLIVLNDLENINSIKSNEAYELLKNSRNNDDKCWPNTCKIDSTTKILRNLFMAGYSSTSRLLQDGASYLQKNMINNENNPLKFVVEIEEELNDTEEISCSLKIDDEDERTYIFEGNETSLEKYASSSISFNCERKVEAISLSIYNLDDSIQKYQEYENTNSFNYNLNSFSCIGESTCSFEQSINTLITYSNEFENYELIENYVDSSITEEYDEIYLNVEKEYEQTGKLLYYNDYPELLEHLKYKQNNDGSWGKDSRYDKIIETSWAVLGLQKNLQNSEYVEDGKKWIYYNEPYSGWGDIEKNTMAYIAIKEKLKPYAVISAKNKIEEETKFVIKNPTIYQIKNLEIIFSDEINKHLSYKESLGDLGPEETINFTVTLDNKFLGKLTGEMIIKGIDTKNKEITLLKMPVNIEGPLPFEIEENVYSISEDYSFVELEIKNNIDNFKSTCTYTNPFSNENNQVTLTQLSSTIPISNILLKDGEFNMKFNCKINDNEFEIPAFFNVSISEKSFNTTDEEIVISSANDFSIELTSITKEKQILSFEIEGNIGRAVEPAEKEKIIAGGDTREIFISVTNPTYLEAVGNATNASLIIKSDQGYVKKIPIRFDLNKEENSNINWVYITIGIFAVLFIFIVIIRYIRLRAEDEEDYITQDDEEIYL